MSRKVTPGQVWECIDTGKQVRIVRVEGTKAFAEYIPGPDGMGLKGTIPFGDLQSNGMPDRMWNRWFYLGMDADYNGGPIFNPPHRLTDEKQTAMDDAKAELNFFRTPTTPGNCVCNILRSQCDYHR